MQMRTALSSWLELVSILICDCICNDIINEGHSARSQIKYIKSSHLSYLKIITGFLGVPQVRHRRGKKEGKDGVRLGFGAFGDEKET